MLLKISQKNTIHLELDLGAQTMISKLNTSQQLYQQQTNAMQMIRR